MHCVQLDFLKGASIMGFHMLDLVVVLLIGLVLVGPKALQSMARSAGKGIKEAKVMKDKVI